MKIAIYGLSIETKKAIDKLDEYEIVGLLDGYKREGILFGKPIISIEDAFSIGIERIIVVARPGSCKAIVQRIGEKCLNAGVQVYDMLGNNLLMTEPDIWNCGEIISFIEEESHKNKNGISEIKKKLFINRIDKICLEKESEMVIKSAYDIGYLFCAPMVTDFVRWFSNYIDEKNVNNIWFLARDGYLIKKLFDRINKKENVYFLTSRTAAIRAGVRDIDDLKYVESMKFEGTLSENIKKRFGIEIDEKKIDDFYNYSSTILNRAELLTERYKKYINNNTLKEGNIAVFDFVAKGTTQFFLQRLVPDNHVEGLYFLQLEPKFMAENKLDIVSFYTQNELEKSVIFDSYYILETILTSFDASFLEFTEQGAPVFDKETRTENDKNCVKSIQQGIMDYFGEFISEVSSINIVVDEDKILDESFLNLIHKVKIQDEDFLKLIIEDPFFNRMTRITEVL